MPKVVSNTTPIISLLKIGRLDLLQEIYGSVIVPEEVYVEVEQGKTKFYYADLSTLKWLEIRSLKDRNALNYFANLDAGEAAVIILATELAADLVIIDETLGRNQAKQSGLKVTGTIGILIKAKKRKLIPKVMPLISDLQAKGVWISNELKTAIAEIVQE